MRGLFSRIPLHRGLISEPFVPLAFLIPPRCLVFERLQLESELRLVHNAGDSLYTPHLRENKLLSRHENNVTVFLCKKSNAVGGLFYCLVSSTQFMYIEKPCRKLHKTGLRINSAKCLCTQNAAVPDKNSAHFIA